MESGYTDSNGEFEIAWIATINDLDNLADAYAEYKGDATHTQSTSKTLKIRVDEVSQNPADNIPYLSSLTLSASSTVVTEGDKVVFSGYLLDQNGQGVPDKLIEIKDDDPLNADDFMASGYTDSSGRFRISWTAESVDLDTEADAYASFGGDSGYDKSRSETVKVKVN